MPNIITHTLFAMDMMDELNLDLLKDHEMLVRAGSNGPDFLFFHNVPLKKTWMKTDLRKYGDSLHAENTNAFYHEVLKAIRAEKNPEIKEQMIAYAIGHLFHWALDSTVHPYIFYRTGAGNWKSSAKHHHFESLLDAVMLKIRRNQSVRDFNPVKEVCTLSPEEKRAVCKVYTPALKAIYKGDFHPIDIADALEDWKRMQQVFRDPKGWKVKALSPFEKLTSHPYLMTGFAIPDRYEDNVDLLNLLHKPWKNPVTLEESDESLLDLEAKARGKAKKAAMLFLDAVQDEKAEEHLIAFLDDLNYDGAHRAPEKTDSYDLIEFDD